MISDGGCLIGEAAKVMGLRSGRNKIAASIKKGSQGDSFEESPASTDWDKDGLLDEAQNDDSNEFRLNGETSTEATETSTDGSKSYSGFFKPSGYFSISQAYAKQEKELNARKFPNLQQEETRESNASDGE